MKLWRKETKIVQEGKIVEEEKKLCNRENKIMEEEK